MLSSVNASVVYSPPVARVQVSASEVLYEASSVSVGSSAYMIHFLFAALARAFMC